MGRQNKAFKERKARAREEKKLLEASNNDTAVEPKKLLEASRNDAAVEHSTPSAVPEASATNSGSDFSSSTINLSSVDPKSKALELVQAREDQRPQETVGVNGTGKEFRPPNQTNGEAPNGCSQISRQNLRIEVSISVGNNVSGGGYSKFGGGYSKFGEASSVVRLQPSKLEARQNPRVEGSNPVEKRVNGVGDFRTSGNGRGVVRGGYGHQASASGVDDFKRIDSLGRLSSSILRHRAEELRLNMRSDGYVLVNDLMNLRLRTSAGLPLSSYTVDDVKEVVRMDNKQRFGLREENGQLLIRANQGHSLLTVKSEDLLSPVYSPEEVPVCVHGTYLRNLEAIQKEGLKRMKRLHVHFATGLLKEKGVISGMRSNCQVLIYLDVQKYLKDGMKLYRSENGVILAEGMNGVIPPDYFAKIERIRS